MRRVACVLWGVLALAVATSRAQLQTPAPTPADPTPVSSLDTSAITIAAVGDIMMGSTFPDSSKLPPNDGADLLSPFLSVLKDPDITFGNLEGPLLEGGVSTKCGPAATPGSCFAFRVPTRYAAYLKDARFTVLNLANNHAGDFGAQGRASTRKVLDELGIAHIGSERGTYATAVLEVKGKRIGFIGFAFNDVAPNINDLPDAKRLVAELKRRADLVVVSLHK